MAFSTGGVAQTSRRFERSRLAESLDSSDNRLGGIMNVTVQAYSGYKSDERPYRFFLDDRSYEVLEVLDRWYGPDSVYFKVQADDQNYYILRYNSEQDEWSLESFRRAQVPG
jgi:hypothetical protein